MPARSITYARFLAKYDLADWQAIVKTLEDDRRMLLGFERKNKRSSKYRIKFLINPPIILDEVVKAHAQQSIPTQAQPIAT